MPSQMWGGNQGTVREQSNRPVIADGRPLRTAGHCGRPVIADGLSLRETTCSQSSRAQRSNLLRSVRRLVRREIASLRSQ
jgi:hypothetical protein